MKVFEALQSQHINTIVTLSDLVSRKNENILHWIILEKLTSVKPKRNNKMIRMTENNEIYVACGYSICDSKINKYQIDEILGMDISDLVENRHIPQMIIAILINEIKHTINVTLADVLNMIVLNERYDDTYEIFKKNHPEVDSDFLQDLLLDLLQIEPNKSDMSITINEIDDCDDDAPLYEIVGYVKGEGQHETYGLSYVDWGEWLGMGVDTKTDIELLFAECLYEMTWHGTNEEDVKKARESLNRVMDYRATELIDIEDLEKLLNSANKIIDK